MAKLIFNRNRFIIGKTVDLPFTDIDSAIEKEKSLWHASLDEVMKFGGKLTKFILEQCPIKYDRKYTFVDVRAQFLMPGFCPARPGWHVDGPLRNCDVYINHVGKKLDVFAQVDEQVQPNHFHTMVVGTDCFTEFLIDPIEIEIPEEHSSKELPSYVNRVVERQVNEKELSIFSLPPRTFVSFDWWNVHRAIVAKTYGWRYWIRVREKDFIRSEDDITASREYQGHLYYVPSK